MVISTLGWILVGAAAWLAVAALLGVLIGRVIRRRDQQVPAEDEQTGFPDRLDRAEGQDRGPSRLAERGRQWRR